MTRPDKHAARFGKRHADRRALLWWIRRINAIVERDRIEDDPRRQRRIRRRAARHPEPSPFVALGGCALCEGSAMAALSHVVRQITEAARRYREMNETNAHIYASPAAAGTHIGGDVIDVRVNPETVQRWRDAGWVMWDRPPASPAQQRTRRVDEFVEWADDVLNPYDADRVGGDQPWPYGSF